MPYTTIDGDISDFMDAAGAAMDVFKTEDLREFLLKEGHSLPEAISALVAWQKDRFDPVDPSWEQFTLNPAGQAAVDELRDRIEG
jgi:hypothetical protein